MECFQQREDRFGHRKENESLTLKEFQKLRNQAYDIVEITRANLGEKPTKSHIKAIILMWTMDLMLNRNSLKGYQADINELLDKRK